MRPIAIRFAVVAVAVLALAQLGHAQTTTVRLNWSTTDSVAVANGFTYSLQDGSSAPVALSTFSCLAAATGGGSTCSAPMTRPSPGPHSYVLSVCSSLSCATSAPLAGSSPNNPTGLSITVTVTVGTPEDQALDGAAEHRHE